MRLSKFCGLTRPQAEASYNQVRDDLLYYSNIQICDGQLQFLAIHGREPASKPIERCRRVTVILTLHKPEEDLKIQKQSGLAGLRRHKLLRITREAIEQGALLSYEDLAVLCTTSVITIKRDMAYLYREGRIIPTRGWQHVLNWDGSLASLVLTLYFDNYRLSEIEKMMNHSIAAVERYLLEFRHVILLYLGGQPIDYINLQAKVPMPIIAEYIDIYKKYPKAKSSRMAHLFRRKKQNSGRT